MPGRTGPVGVGNGPSRVSGRVNPPRIRKRPWHLRHQGRKAADGKGSKRRPNDPDDPPIGQHGCSQSPIELDRRSIPVKNRPFEATAAAFHGNLRKGPEQRLRAALAAILGADEEVLEPESAAPDERREIVEKQRESSGFGAIPRDQHLGRRLGAEQSGVDIRFCCNAQMREPLVIGKGADHHDDRAEVRSSCGPDIECRSCARHAHSFRLWGFARLKLAWRHLARSRVQPSPCRRRFLRKCGRGAHAHSRVSIARAPLVRLDRLAVGLLHCNIVQTRDFGARFPPPGHKTSCAAHIQMRRKIATSPGRTF